MRFTVIVENDRGRMVEEYDKPGIADPNVWARDTIARFNATLRPKELPRRLIEVRIGGVSELHQWEKHSVATIMDHLGTYDTMRCRHCGITGKRFGLSGAIRRDSKFRAKKYAKCDGEGKRSC